MAVDTSLVLPGRVAHERSSDHRFFTGMALASALTVFIGFARTYYLRSVFDGPAVPTALVHLHGLVFTAWVVLFVSQTSLVAAGRTDVHRRLGVVGAGLVVLLVVVGWLTAIAAARRGVTPPGGPPPLQFLSVPLGTLLAFAVLVVAGLVNRRQRETHKRLMLLATIALLTPAIARFRFVLPGGPLLAILNTTLFVLVCLAWDRAAHGRIHRAFLWGGLFLIVSLPVRFAIGRTAAWSAVAEWLTR
jgi:hypothetical protein